MQAKSASKESGSHATQSFFASRAMAAPAFFPAMAQAKCAACDGVEKVQRKSEPEAEDAEFVQPKILSPASADDGTPSVQAKCGPCMEKGINLQQRADDSAPGIVTGSNASLIQPKLTLGAPGDRFEQEADRAADTVMRSSAPVGAISPATPEHVQRDGAETCTFGDEKEKGEEDEAVEDPIPGEKGDPFADDKEDKEVSPKRAQSGAVIPSDLESRIDASHGGGRALDPGTRGFMQSRFGYDFSGVRIHTGAGAESMNRDIRSFAFTSGSDIFFNSGQYRPETDSGRHLLAHELTHVVQQNGQRGGGGIVHEKTDPRLISRAGKAEEKWYHHHTVSGTQVHGELGKILRGADPAKDLVTEAAIPGANRHAVKLNNIGIADLYKSTPEKTVTGIKGLREVNSLEDLISMNSPEANDTQPKVNSSPTLGLPIGVKKKQGVKRVLSGDFPQTVSLGEIKPANTSKLADGWAQLDNYEQGYKKFVERVYTITGTTRPSITVNRLKVKLPDELNFNKFDSQSGTKYKPATFGDRRLWVAEAGADTGIYLYEDLAEGLRGQPSEWHSKYWPKLLKVRAGLTDKHTGSSKMGQGKSAPGARQVQRKDPDKSAAWENERKDFGKEFRGELASKYRTYRDKVRFEKKLGKSGRSMPEKEKTEVKEYKSMMFWSGFGGKLVGRVRFMLGSVWDKAVEIFEKMKKKMGGMRDDVRKISESNVAGFGWAKALIKVVVAASKVAAAAFITESFNFFAECFQSAMDKVVEQFKVKLLNTELGQKLCRAHQFFLSSKEKLKTEWGGAIEKLQDLLAVIQETKKWVEIATSVIDLIRIGVQVISCLTPPALGCLWGLVAQIGIGAALGIVVGTQWFNDNIVTPQVRKIVRKYAAPHYQSMINRVLGENLKEYHCDIADKNFPSLEFEAKDGLKDGTKGMQDHRDAWEKENEGQMIVDLQKVFTKKDGTPVTKENLQELIKQIQAKKFNIGQIKTVLNQARDSSSSKIDVEVVTRSAAGGGGGPKAAADTQIAKKRDIDYPKATHSNKALQKMHGWDPMIFYKQPLAKADSEEFADAVYDLQQALKVKADGILGDETLIAFYDRNKLKNDLAYRASVDSLEKARLAKAQAEKDLAEKRKAARDKATAGKGSGPGAKPGYKLLDASEFRRKSTADVTYPKGVEIYIQSPAVGDFVEKKEENLYVMNYKPTHVTVDVFVDHKHVYRVENVVLGSSELWKLLTQGPIDPWSLYVSFKEGIELPTEKGQLSVLSDEWRVN